MEITNADGAFGYGPRINMHSISFFVASWLVTGVGLVHTAADCSFSAGHSLLPIVLGRVDDGVKSSASLILNQAEQQQQQQQGFHVR